MKHASAEFITPGKLRNHPLAELPRQVVKGVRGALGVHDNQGLEQCCPHVRLAILKHCVLHVVGARLRTCEVTFKIWVARTLEVVSKPTDRVAWPESIQIDKSEPERRVDCVGKVIQCAFTARWLVGRWRGKMRLLSPLRRRGLFRC